MGSKISYYADKGANYWLVVGVLQMFDHPMKCFHWNTDYIHQYTSTLKEWIYGTFCESSI